MQTQSIVTNGHMRTLQKETPLCQECGSTDIGLSGADIVATWDDLSQCWKVIDGFLIEEGFCNNCESECDIAWVSS